MDVVFGHADRIVVLDRGRLVAQGSQEEVRVDPEVKRIYLGESA
jgi:branched-chain amino acid transport system ATP-binding protein